MLTFVLLGVCSAAAVAQGDEGDTRLTEYLKSCESGYSSEVAMLGTKWHSPGYHTRVPNGEWVHRTRESLVYALALLQSGRARPHRACSRCCAQGYWPARHRP